MILEGGSPTPQDLQVGAYTFSGKNVTSHVTTPFGSFKHALWGAYNFFIVVLVSYLMIKKESTESDKYCQKCMVASLRIFREICPNAAGSK